MTRARTLYPAPSPDTERDALILRFVPLVHYVFDRLAVTLPQHLDRDDLISAGTCGLIQAANNYDANKGASFKSHAYSRVMGAMIDTLRSADALPRQRRQALRRLNQACADLTTPDGPPTLNALAKALETTEEELEQLLDLAQRVRLVSLEAPTTGEESSQLRDGIAAPAERPPWLKASGAEDLDDLRAALVTLADREREVLGLYYFQNLLLREIGEVLGVSESRVCQLRTRAICNLRTAVLQQRARVAKAA